MVLIIIVVVVLLVCYQPAIRFLNLRVQEQEFRTGEAKKESEARIKGFEVIIAQKNVEIGSLRENASAEVESRTRERALELSAKELALEEEKLTMASNVELKIEKTRIEAEQLKRELQAKLCEHKFGQCDKKDVQYCEKCGQARKFPLLNEPHTCVWKNLESYVMSNTASGNVTGHSYIQQCNICGELRQKYVKI